MWLVQGHTAVDKVKNQTEATSCIVLAHNSSAVLLPLGLCRFLLCLLSLTSDRAGVVHTSPGPRE